MVGYLQLLQRKILQNSLETVPNFGLEALMPVTYVPQAFLDV